MAWGFATALRNAESDAIIAFAGGACQLKFYTGTKPSTGGAITTQTLLGTLTCGTPFGTTASGVLTMSAVTQDSSADATGTATWARILKSDGATHVMDGTVTVTGGGGDIQLDNVNIVAGGTISISSTSTQRTFTIGNP